MADLYNYASQFTLGQLFRGGQNVLQGAANLLNQAGIGTRGTPLTGRQKINKAWGMLGTASEPAGGDFGYRTGNGKPYSQPSYADAQGNIYDAVSGRLLYPAKTRPGADTGSSAAGASSFSGGSPAAERAYQSEASRVAQLTAQDPELQRYEAARLKAVAPGATPETVQAAEDIGMQIWRQKYGTTPMGQTGGAVGSFNPLMRETFGYQTGMAPDQLTAMQKTAAPIPVAPGAMPYQMGDLGTRVSETGYDPAAYGLTPDKIEEMKKKLLQQASK